eukprot:11178103-Lingulodinium_polyedra.AAC.1
MMANRALASFTMNLPPRAKMDASATAEAEEAPGTGAAGERKGRKGGRARSTLCQNGYGDTRARTYA